MPLRVASPLSAEIETIVTQIIGAAIVVHQRLGPGLKEAQYEDALKIELATAGLKFESQRRVIITYRGQSLRPQRIDLIVEEQIVVEVKSVARLHPVHRSQVISYLRTTGLRIGLLFNFNEPIVRIKRVVL
jgi:GxxExxY protein